MFWPRECCASSISRDEEVRLPFAAKRQSYAEPPSAVQLGCIYRMRQIAESMACTEYSEASLRNALPRLQALMSEPEEARHFPRVLSECGVRFVVVEHMPSSKLDGVCFWLSRSAPVIGMTLRHDRIDNFWFVLRHEIEHVLNRDGDVIDNDLMNSDEADLPDDEIVANSAAAEFCTPQEQLSDFVARQHPIYSEQRLMGFARLLGIHPGIVAGQLRNRIKRFDIFAKSSSEDPRDCRFYSSDRWVWTFLFDHTLRP